MTKISRPNVRTSPRKRTSHSNSPQLFVHKQKDQWRTHGDLCFWLVIGPKYFMCFNSWIAPLRPIETLTWWSSSVLGWSQRSLQRPWKKRGQHKGSKLGCKSKKTSPPGSWPDYDPKTWFWFKFQVTFKWRRLYINGVHLRVIKPGSRMVFAACLNVNVILVVTITWFGAPQALGKNSGYYNILKN